MIPKDLTRVTNHKTPRHQLYQPGFNNFNSCWLAGAWITVPADEFKKRAAEHKKLYAGIHKQAAKQSHRDKGTPVSKMTPGQKQAWEFYSGEPTVDVRWSNGVVGIARVKTAGKVVSAESLEWLKAQQMRVIPKVLKPDGKITDQTKMVPPDMLTDDAEPVNVWQLIVKQNKARFKEFAKGTVAAIKQNPSMAPLMEGVAVQHLFELEKQIIRMQVDPKPDPFESLDEVRAEYVEHRKEMRDALGENFQKVYDEAKASLNACKRANLNSSNGVLFCFVLPKFHDDGTHEPWGPRDIPWAKFKGAKEEGSKSPDEPNVEPGHAGEARQHHHPLAPA